MIEPLNQMSSSQEKDMDQLCVQISKSKTSKDADIDDREETETNETTTVGPRKKKHLLYLLILLILAQVMMHATLIYKSLTFRHATFQPLIINMDADPPFHKVYENLFDKTIKNINYIPQNLVNKDDNELFIVEECELPIIDLNRLYFGELEREKCKTEIARASKEWGFFQIVNHGISSEILEKMRFEQKRIFKQPFDKKIKEDKYLKFPSGSYRWGTPSATNLGQFSWSEAFHIPLIDISRSSGFDGFGTIVQQFATTVSNLAQKLAKILAERMGHESTFFQENCLPSTCYLRMNHYPPCPIALDDQVSGLTPHTDSDFLTILHQDQVGGLQLVKDGKWIAVKPNPEALIINIGDLFQAWSNGTYVSVQHRVVTNPVVERFSTAYFFCPAYDTVIQSCCEPAIYKEFSFREYRQQVQADVQKLGTKIGLSRFLV